jgi:signal transduction histidine kinase
LVDTFLTLSRENKDPIANFSTFKAEQIIQEEIDDIKNTSGANRLEPSLTTDYVLTLEGVPQMFRVVIRNLLRNALHHTQQGDIIVKILPDSIHVEDTGTGIPEELKNSIFKRHYRVTSLENKSQGEGIGLSIVKRICDYHGWQISVESVQPHGSRFIITFAPSKE